MVLSHFRSRKVIFLGGSSELDVTNVSALRESLISPPPSHYRACSSLERLVQSFCMFIAYLCMTKTKCESYAKSIHITEQKIARRERKERARERERLNFFITMILTLLYNLLNPPVAYILTAK